MIYENFQKINGTHPWRKVSPEGYIDYPVRFRKGGRVLFFNFPLARELGLIGKNHPAKMSRKLEEAILGAFSLQILNEHDWQNRKQFPRDGYEDRLYMATRYLQIQHDNKQGKTSGDGRSIWNGYLETDQGIVYDFSSRGTGNTILSPGAQETKEPIPTGSNEHGYSSGLADLDEMLGSALMSEIFYQKRIPTERTLTVIDYQDKTSIGVRAATNLIRPAHFFRYLKSNMYDELKASYDYFLDRQEYNREYKIPKEGRDRYYASLDLISRQYAYLAALMEEEYIFNWLAWDGDNILAHGALLDYGSIRQFAAKHNKYRYDDVDRFSTTLSEQKREARYMVQTFVQAVDYILKGEKKSIQSFDNSKYLKLFDKEYEIEGQRRMLWNLGFIPSQIEKLIKRHQKEIKAFRQALNYFEDVKTAEGEQEVPDGIDHPPVYLVRNIFRELPAFLLAHKDEGAWPIMPAEEFCAIMAKSYLDDADLELTPVREERAFQFQQYYQDLIFAASRNRWVTLKHMSKRSEVINHEYRHTGDGLTWVVHEAIQAKDKMDQNLFQEIMDRYIKSQVLVPGKFRPFKEAEMSGPSKKAQLLAKMFEMLDVYKETI